MTKKLKILSTKCSKQRTSSTSLLKTLLAGVCLTSSFNLIVGENLWAAEKNISRKNNTEYDIPYKLSPETINYVKQKTDEIFDRNVEIVCKKNGKNYWANDKKTWGQSLENQKKLIARAIREYGTDMCDIKGKFIKTISDIVKKPEFVTDKDLQKRVFGLINGLYFYTSCLLFYNKPMWDFLINKTLYEEMFRPNRAKSYFTDYICNETFQQVLFDKTTSGILNNTLKDWKSSAKHDWYCYCTQYNVFTNRNSDDDVEEKEEVENSVEEEDEEENNSEGTMNENPEEAESSEDGLEEDELQYSIISDLCAYFSSDDDGCANAEIGTLERNCYEDIEELRRYIKLTKPMQNIFEGYYLNNERAQTINYCRISLPSTLDRLFEYRNKKYPRILYEVFPSDFITDFIAMSDCRESTKKLCNRFYNIAEKQWSILGNKADNISRLDYFNRLYWCVARFWNFMKKDSFDKDHAEEVLCVFEDFLQLFPFMHPDEIFYGLYNVNFDDDSLPLSITYEEYCARAKYELAKEIKEEMESKGFSDGQYFWGGDDFFAYRNILYFDNYKKGVFEKGSEFENILNACGKNFEKQGIKDYWWFTDINMSQELEIDLIKAIRNKVAEAVANKAVERKKEGKDICILEIIENLQA